MPGTKIDEAKLDVQKLVPRTAMATVSTGAAIIRSSPEEIQRHLESTWSVLHDHDQQPAPPPPPPPPPPEQLGPFNWSPIVFGGGVPVGGWAQLTLFRTGGYNFTGHFHGSGAPSYDTSCVFAVRDAGGTVYTFSHRGRVHGTFESGSRDDDWGDSGTNPALAAGWGNLAAAWSWHANAAANGDFGQLFDQAVKALGQAAAVIAIV